MDWADKKAEEIYHNSMRKEDTCALIAKALREAWKEGRDDYKRKMIEHVYTYNPDLSNKLEKEPEAFERGWRQGFLYGKDEYALLQVEEAFKRFTRNL